MENNRIKDFLENQLDRFNRETFIKDDPIAIPHRFSQTKDIEIAAFLAAIFAWGNRKIILQKSTEFLNLLDNAPYEFIISHQQSDLGRFKNFKHRTFNFEDAKYFLIALKHIYQKFESLEDVFTQGLVHNEPDIEKSLINFRTYFLAIGTPLKRTEKHIASPISQSACKRLNMFLRWMVRHDDRNVDFGLWKKINPSQLIIPLDLHVKRVTKELGMIEFGSNEWQNAKKLTNYLKQFDKNDPVKFDFALFGTGVNNNNEAF